MFYVYKIENTVNGKLYVGKTKAPASRWAQHKAKARGRHYLPVHQAINKYGADKFTFTIVETLDTEEQSFERERHYVALWKTRGHGGYNLTDGGDGVRALVYTPEMRARMSASHKGKPSPRKGVRLSQETRAKLSESHKGHRHTDEQKRKIGEASRGHRLSDESKAKLSANLAEAWKRSGYKQRIRGAQCGAAKLDDERVIRLRALAAAGGHTQKDLATMFGITRNTVRMIVSRKTWAHIPAA